jgi:excisionase family DNA binding protein
MNDTILTVPEIAVLLRVADKTVYSLAQRGELPAFKVGGQWRFSRAAIQSWIDHRTSASQSTEGNRRVADAASRTRGPATQTQRRRS